MIVYSAEKHQFLHDAFERDIEEVVLNRFAEVLGKRVARQEIASWKASLLDMARVLKDPDIPADMGVAIEFHIPQTAKRIDVTLSGRGAEGQKVVLIVELKQWTEVQSTVRDGIVRTYLGGAVREVVHPSYQAWSYASLLEGFNSAVHEGGIALQPCAYLHNYVADGQIDAPHYAAYVAKAPLFLKGERDRARLRDFIKSFVRHGDQRAVLYELAEGRIKPSKALADALKGMLANRPEFVLIDEQKSVFEAVRAAATSASSARPRVLIIRGGPGTGKTVLAINLLVTLTQLGLLGRYVSKNAAPRAVYEARLTGTITRTRFSNLFGGSGAFIGTPPDTFDFLLVDEAHRLNAKSGLYGNLGENQIKELIEASRCCVFFLDEDQRVTLNDIGEAASIRQFANAKGAVIEEFALASQFRCAGSDGYLAWLDDTLDIRPTANFRLSRSEFDVRVFDDPGEMHAAITSLNTDNRARVVAGYCWPWVSKQNPAAYDITIGDHYRRQWNLASDQSLWIVAERSVEQVGCIHTCQGLEVDYIGVIIGPDLVVRDGRVQTHPDRRDRHDKTIRGWKTRLKQDQAVLLETDRIIKNTYRTLMTRGMKGCFLFSADAETAAYFRRRLDD